MEILRIIYIDKPFGTIIVNDMKVVTIDELIKLLEEEIQREKKGVTYTEEDATYTLGVVAGLERAKNTLKNIK